MVNANEPKTLLDAECFDVLRGRYSNLITASSEASTCPSMFTVKLLGTHGFTVTYPRKDTYASEDVQVFEVIEDAARISKFDGILEQNAEDRLRWNEGAKTVGLVMTWRLKDMSVAYPKGMAVIKNPSKDGTATRVARLTRQKDMSEPYRIGDAYVVRRDFTHPQTGDKVKRSAAMVLSFLKIVIMLDDREEDETLDVNMGVKSICIVGMFTSSICVHEEVLFNVTVDGVVSNDVSDVLMPLAGELGNNTYADWMKMLEKKDAAVAENRSAFLASIATVKVWPTLQGDDEDVDEDEDEDEQRCTFMMKLNEAISYFIWNLHNDAFCASATGLQIVSTLTVYDACDGWGDFIRNYDDQITRPDNYFVKLTMDPKYDIISMTKKAVSSVADKTGTEEPPVVESAKQPSKATKSSKVIDELQTWPKTFDAARTAFGPSRAIWSSLNGLTDKSKQKKAKILLDTFIDLNVMDDGTLKNFITPPNKPNVTPSFNHVNRLFEFFETALANDIEYKQKMDETKAKIIEKYGGTDGVIGKKSKSNRPIQLTDEDEDEDEQDEDDPDFEHTRPLKRARTSVDITSLMTTIKPEFDALKNILAHKGFIVNDFTSAAIEKLREVFREVAKAAEDPLISKQQHEKELEQKEAKIAELETKIAELEKKVTMQTDMVTAAQDRMYFALEQVLQPFTRMTVTKELWDAHCVRIGNKIERDAARIKNGPPTWKAVKNEDPHDYKGEFMQDLAALETKSDPLTLSLGD